MKVVAPAPVPVPVRSLSELKNLLNADKAEYTFEQERMARFVELLGFPNGLSSYMNSTSSS
jgi:hypothetical protein